ncbi:MFS transporter [Coralloluteibacterium stylophorae]|uniref:MFS transporter n=1 Tax=Coralloluteibacterium stylophorae TaxID=1776034 RepID=A0A8J7VQE3_9GAMM|nr:MFS transporter [Coralloluteibacterium stylophorae]MBS7458110.1 MFS transporter [Coralloluteibacterium stylophorae]
MSAAPQPTADTPDVPPANSDGGPWAPLAVPTFRALWLAILVGNIGTWVNDVAAAWVMAERTASPLMVAAVQSATTLPVVLFALLAGTLADIVDRRRYLIATQLWMLMVASALALLAHLDALGPWALLALTFALGTGAALAMPAQAATTPELVPRPLLAPAVALGSVSMNIARSIGPALGGLVVAQAGAAWAFALNAASFLGVVLVLWRWKREARVSTLPPERFAGALRAGLRYAGQASAFRAVLWKAASFFVFASAMPALLPVVVRGSLGAGAGTFGVLLGCIGVGAIGGALVLPRLRARVDRDRLVLAATLLCAASLVGLALLRNVPALGLVLLANGMGWISVLSSLQIAVQGAVPAWVRARALSLYIVVFSLGMASGSLLWGALAQRAGVPWALLAAAAGAVVAALWATRFRLAAAEGLDVAPSAHWPQPAVAAGHADDHGPVLVTVEYRIDAADRAEFLDLVRTLGRSRRRDGALEWRLFEDMAEPGLYQESFVLGSWLEHLRQHERVTGEERRLQARLHALHRDPAPPRVRHLGAGRG